MNASKTLSYESIGGYGHSYSVVHPHISAPRWEYRKKALLNL
jgi:hypothetical protein